MMDEDDSRGAKVCSAAQGTLDVAEKIFGGDPSCQMTYAIMVLAMMIHKLKPLSKLSLDEVLAQAIGELKRTVEAISVEEEEEEATIQ